MLVNNKYELSENNSKFIRYLTAFNTRKDWKRFRKFIESPFFNNSKKMVNFYKLIDKKFPFDTPIYKTDLLPVIGQKKKYSNSHIITNTEDNHLRRLISEFTHLIKEFFQQIEAENYPVYRNRMFVTAMMKRQKYALVDRIIEKENPRNNLKYYTRDYLDYYLFVEPSLYRSIINKNRKYPAVLQETLQVFRNYYLGNLLRLLCTVQNAEQLLNSKHDIPEYEWILDYLNKNYQDYDPYIQAFYFAFQLMMDNKKVVFFDSLLKLLYEHGTNFDIKELRDLYGHLLNYCSNKIRTGKSEFHKEKRKIYLIALTQKVLTQGIYFSEHQFIGIVINALNVGEHEWTNSFINDYSSCLSPKQKEPFYNFAKANYAFHMGNFDEALHYLNNIHKKEDVFYAINLKILQLKIYFEQFDNFQLSIDSHLNSLTIYLFRDKKMSGDIKFSYERFQKIFAKIVRVKNNLIYQKFKSYPSRKADKLKREIKASPQLQERVWLLKKVEELSC